MADSIFSPEISHDEALFTLGQVLFDDRGRAWAYVHATAAIKAQHAVSWLPGTWDIAEVTAARLSGGNGNHAVGIVTVNIPADDFCWAQVFGQAVAHVEDVDADSFSYTTSSAGVLGDDSSGQQRTRNIVWLEGRSGSGAINVWLNWPGANHYV